MPYAVLAAGRAVGELSSAVMCGDITLGEAELAARLGYDLDMDDADWVIEQLRECDHFALQRLDQMIEVLEDEDA